MTHEYDDPINPEAVAAAARRIAERHRVEDRPLDLLVEEVVLERFCGCVTSANDSRSASILAGRDRCNATRPCSCWPTAGSPGS